MDSPLRDRYPPLTEHAVHTPTSVPPSHTHTHTHNATATGRPQPCLSCNTFSTEPSSQLVATGVRLWRTSVFVTALYDHNRYTTAHALTLALIFRASLSACICVVFLYGERKIRKRNAVGQGSLPERPICWMKEHIKFCSLSLIQLRVLQYVHARLCVCACVYVF
jgi:hypothetical protein